MSMGFVAIAIAFMHGQVAAAKTLTRTALPQVCRSMVDRRDDRLVPNVVSQFVYRMGEVAAHFAKACILICETSL